MKSKYLSYESRTRLNFNCCYLCEVAKSPNISDNYCSEIPLLEGYVLRSCPKFVKQKDSVNE